MKKIILVLLVGTLIGCQIVPVLNKTEYNIVDTLNIGRNGSGNILEYDIILKYDNSYYFGTINSDGVLIRMNNRKIKTEKLK